MEFGDGQRRVFALLRDIVFAYIAVNTTYEFSSAIYQRGISAVLFDCQRWVKLVQINIILTTRHW